MIVRLARIEILILVIATVTTVAAMTWGSIRPLGVVLGGGTAWLDFVAIKGLAGIMLARGTKPEGLVPLAMTKSAMLLAVPAVALFVPGTLVDGTSFAIGVTALPLAIVADACWPVMGDARGGEA